MFSLGCPWNIPSCIFLQLQQFRAQQQLSVGIDTRQRDHDDAGRDASVVGPADALRQQLLSPGLSTGTSGSPVVGGSMLPKNKGKAIKSLQAGSRHSTAWAGYCTKCARLVQSYAVLNALVDLRVVEVCKAHEH